MSISKTKRNFLGLLTLFTAIFGGGGGVIIYYLLPEHYFEAYPVIPIYFYLLGVISIFLFDVCRRSAPQKLALVYLALKVFKLLVSVIFLLIYCVAFHAFEKQFLMTFMGYYVIYLIFETWFFFSFEMNRIKRK